MYPGDFTPLWEKAEYSESDGNAGGMDGETSQSIDPTFFATTINNIKEKLADRLGTT